MDMHDFFGPPISVYTNDQAVADGFKVKLHDGIFMTTNAVHRLAPGALDPVTNELDGRAVHAVLVPFMKRYDGGDFGEADDNDRHFASYTINGETVFFILDGEGMHILLAEDY